MVLTDLFKTESMYTFSRKMEDNWTSLHLERFKDLRAFIKIQHSKKYLVAECTEGKIGLPRANPRERLPLPARASPENSHVPS